MLRKAYQALENFDQRYADALGDLVEGDPKGTGPVHNARKGLATLLNSYLRPHDLELDGSETAGMVALGRVMQGVGTGTAATVRYALPGAGITAAGAGLAELTGLFKQQTEATLDP